MRTWTSLLPPLAVVPVRRTAPPGIDRLGPPTRRHLGATLELEQPALRLETSGVPAQRPVARDDAVAGDHDRDRVVPDRTGRGAVGLVVTRLVRDLRVGDELAVRDSRGDGPDLPLERRERRQVDGDVELPAPAAEVLIEL